MAAPCQRRRACGSGGDRGWPRTYLHSEWWWLPWCVGGGYRGGGYRGGGVYRDSAQIMYSNDPSIGYDRFQVLNEPVGPSNDPSKYLRRVCVCVCVCIYIYIYIERERER